MSNATKRAPRSVDDLRPADRERLERAQRRLREAVAAYEPLLSATLAPRETSPVHDAHEIAAAQAEVQSAEGALWQLRDELLGWARPVWAPSASLVADWFSDEDRIYEQA